MPIEPPVDPVTARHRARTASTLLVAALLATSCGADAQKPLADASRGETPEARARDDGTPPVPTGRRARLWALHDEMVECSLFPPVGSQALAMWMVEGGAPPLGVADRLAAAREPMEELERLLAEGEVQFGLREDAYGPSRDGVLKPLLLLPIMGMCNWLAYEALSSEDPTRHLEAMDRFRDCLAKPPGQVEYFILIAAEGARDRLYVALAARGWLPDAIRDRWLAEQPRYAESCREALRGQRVHQWEPLALRMEDGLEPGPEARFGDLAGLRRWIDVSRRVEAQLRGGADDAELDELETLASDATGRPDLEIGGWLRSMCTDVIRVTTRHSVARVAVLALASGQDLPADEAQLFARVGEPGSLAAGRWSLALRYERPAPHTLRVTVDPKSPVPRHLGDGRDLTAGSFGDPPAMAPFVFRSHTVEIRVSR